MQVNLSERPCRYEVSYDVKNVYRYENEKLFFSTLLKKQKKLVYRKIKYENLSVCFNPFTNACFCLLNNKHRLWALLLHVALFHRNIFCIIYLLQMEICDNNTVSNRSSYVYGLLIV